MLCLATRYLRFTPRILSIFSEYGTPYEYLLFYSMHRVATSHKQAASLASLRECLGSRRLPLAGVATLAQRQGPHPMQRYSGCINKPFSCHMSLLQPLDTLFMEGLPSVYRGIWGLQVFTADRNNTSCTAIFCHHREIRVKSSKCDKKWGSP